RFVYAPLFHFDIVNDKVWLQQNSTDLLITEDLLKRDIPKSDIVLGFKPQYARAFEGFGIA
ncbi:MAG: element excision factor XisI family protein, partial [Bacteroidota bacterium]